MAAENDFSLSETAKAERARVLESAVQALEARRAEEVERARARERARRGTLGEVAAEMKKRFEGLPRASGPIPAEEYDGPCTKGRACPICEGVGYYRIDVPFGDKRFGKAQRCPNVDITRLPWWGKVGLRDKELSLNWDMILPIGDGGAINAAAAVRSFLETASGGWVYLYGSHGVAKSLILKIVVAEAIRKNIPAAYANMSRILSDMRAAYDERNPSAEAASRLEWWSELRVLCIDEINLIHGTDWAENRRFEMMDGRYTGGILGESFTIIASNKPPEALGSWLADRISDGRFLRIPIYGASARPEMTDGEKF